MVLQKYPPLPLPVSTPPFLLSLRACGILRCVRPHTFTFKSSLPAYSGLHWRCSHGETMREAQSPISICASRLAWIMMLVLRHSAQRFTDGRGDTLLQRKILVIFQSINAPLVDWKKFGNQAREHLSRSPLSIPPFKSKRYKTQSKSECGRERMSGCQLAHISQLELLYASR